MKILILSCNNGGGHNAVAAALKERFSERGDDCCIVDAMSFLPAGWSKLMSETHSFAADIRMRRSTAKAFSTGIPFPT